MDEFKVGDKIVDKASGEEGRIVSIDTDDDVDPDIDDGRRIWILLAGSRRPNLRADSEIELA